MEYLLIQNRETASWHAFHIDCVRLGSKDQLLETERRLMNGFLQDCFQWFVVTSYCYNILSVQEIMEALAAKNYRQHLFFYQRICA